VSDSSATLGVFLDVTSTEALMKRVLTTAMAAALLLFTVASASAAREKPDATSTTISPNVRETIPDRAAERRASEPHDRDDKSFIKWIPIVVPLFAVLIAIMVYLIDAAVL
jgi:hypothetical protein